MTIKYAQLKGIMEAFAEINKQPMSFKTKRKLRDAEEALFKEVAWLENERVILATEYSFKNEQGEPIINEGKFDMEDIGAFNKRFAELLVVEVDIPEIKLEDVELFTLSGNHWDSLNLIIRDGD